MKRALFWTILASFAAIVVVTLLGITGILSIRDRYLAPLFTALVLELVAAVLLLFRKTDFLGEDRRPSQEEKWICGHWWELIHDYPEIAVSDVRVLPPSGQRPLRLEGTAYRKDGGRVAEWWTEVASLNNDTLVLSYLWNGYLLQGEGKGQPLLGIGQVRFRPPPPGAASSDSAHGWFTSGDIWKLTTKSMQVIDLRRLTESEQRTMSGSDDKAKTRAARSAYTTWSAAAPAKEPEPGHERAAVPSEPVD